MTVKMERPMVHSEDLADPYPVFLKGPVAKGFGRGSKDLGIRTANLPQEVADQAEEHLKTGIYFGFASVGRSNEVNAMVMSFGWNPFYNNTKRSAEVHILHDFDADFYDEEIRVAVCGFIRDEQNYSSLDDLIKDINIDIEVAKNSLIRPDYAAVKDNQFLKPAK